ncbi:biotin--[acetyl-CoA-carboxylase] ligase [Microaerobacter geothermalis]|uniref:biotin--[acetyl-CoA-carboxylase] ligase n=1 Tax=Microaerobacter geothermalis TaxID=674972 RepID=UPI001F45B6D6|nr:biotin--[acetyl-CoA-carboxylase] ligase [Microaerobacter geothermalis]MCF6093351.1 biotin--[acetyl-CoA-carboxylase] ligase [Microaerobacter geothermalis]
MREEILRLFKEADGEFLSGEKLSQLLNCSRTAVWKHIEELRKEGYQFEAVKKSGYRLVKSPDTLLAEEIKANLNTSMIGKKVAYFHQVDSTQFKAQHLAKEGAPSGTVVIADEQLGGKGRLGRAWQSPPGSGIWMSLILRPPISLFQAPQFTLLTSVAVIKGIRKIYPILDPVIKWPNDILVNRKKVCGILTELNAEADKINYLIIGIGINVNQKESDFISEIKDKATSLYITSGQRISRSKLVQAILENFEQLYHLYLEIGFSPIKTLWETNAISIGEYIEARTINGSLFGKALGIDDEGYLLLQDREEKIHRIYSADIEI